MAPFPWPVADDELLLNQALADVIKAYGPAGENEAALVRGAASNWIMEAYEQGVRDEATLVHFALKALRGGRTRRL